MRTFTFVCDQCHTDFQNMCRHIIDGDHEGESGMAPLQYCPYTGKAIRSDSKWRIICIEEEDGTIVTDRDRYIIDKENR